MLWHIILSGDISHLPMKTNLLVKRMESYVLVDHVTTGFHRLKYVPLTFDTNSGTIGGSSVWYFGVEPRDCSQIKYAFCFALHLSTDLFPHLLLDYNVHRNGQNLFFSL